MAKKQNIGRKVVNYFSNLLKAAAGGKVKQEGVLRYLDEQDEMERQYLIDFSHNRFMSSYGTPISGGNAEGEINVNDPKFTVTPKQVVEELYRGPKLLELQGLDTKIEILKKKEKLINHHYTNLEVKGLILMLECRKKYQEKSKFLKKTYQEFFSCMETTDEEKISTLTSKYEHLDFRNADLFVPEMPDDAVELMETYTETVKELTGKKPLFFVIAKKEEFKKKEEKRDPILLGQSPFGLYYYILGAWDEEMQYLPEL